MIKAIIIDDEPSAVSVLSLLLKKKCAEDVQVVATTNSPAAAKGLIELHKPDLVFLDIEMPTLNGIELARLIKHKTNKLVFTTAHANYAIHSYELEADAFLLKPFSQQKFDQIIKRLFSNSSNVQAEKSNDFILLKSDEQKNRFIKIKLDKIYAVEAQERLTKIYLENEVIFSRSSFSEALALLTTNTGFSQIHRSFIIAESQIKTLERLYVILNNNIRISIGRKYLDFYHKMSKKK